MNTNVVSLFGKSKVPEADVKPTGLIDIISSIIDWAERRGLDVHNDTGLEIRIADLMSYMQSREMEHRLSA